MNSSFSISTSWLKSLQYAGLESENPNTKDIPQFEPSPPLPTAIPAGMGLQVR